MIAFNETTCSFALAQAGTNVAVAQRRAERAQRVLTDTKRAELSAMRLHLAMVDLRKINEAKLMDGAGALPSGAILTAKSYDDGTFTIALRYSHSKSIKVRTSALDVDVSVPRLLRAIESKLQRLTKLRS